MLDREKFIGLRAEHPESGPGVILDVNPGPQTAKFLPDAYDDRETWVNITTLKLLQEPGSQNRQQP